MTTISAKCLAKALERRFVECALPGDLDGFGEADRLEAAGFVAKVAARRAANTPRISLETGVGLDMRAMRLAIVNDDMPFLVDTVVATVTAHDIAIRRLIHPVVAIVRKADGSVAQVDPACKNSSNLESIIYVEMERADARERAGLVRKLECNLNSVRAAATDWPKLRDLMGQDAKRVVDPEGAALLRWFQGGGMTLLGHAHWTADAGISSLSGIWSEQLDGQILSDVALKHAADWFADGRRAPLLLKSNVISPVHRRVPLDLVVVPIRNASGISGLSIHAGLWTDPALEASPADVPVLRSRIAALQSKFGFDPLSHNGKTLARALTGLPNDLIAGLPAEALERLALTAMSVTDRPRPKLLLVPSMLGQLFFAFVWLPRDDVTIGRRVAIGEIVATAASADLLSWSISLDDGPVALLRYTLDCKAKSRVPDIAALDKQLERMVRGWLPAVEASLLEEGLPATRATRLALRYASGFPPSYRSAYGAMEAARDVVRIASLDGEGSRSVRIFYRNGKLRIKLYRLSEPLALSDAVPVFENFGFRVIEEIPTALTCEPTAYLHDFSIAMANGRPFTGQVAVIEQALADVLEGRSENDAFNRLIVEADLKPPSVLHLRAWFRYLRQAGLAYGLDTVVDALRRAPVVATALVERFAAAHDPARAKDSVNAVRAADARILSGLEGVSGIEDDRILRAFVEVVRATLRTNAFMSNVPEALAFKFDSSKVSCLPAPLPWREIWVYSPRVEGVHLRTGPIARGGLRWSDRRDDFRTEILGLVKAQRVKNAVIVPSGAKGGFYPKRLPDPAIDRDAWFEEGKESYRIFIRSLLSVTDNIDKGRVVHPEGILIYDDEDPYFVVAADKGTATFSDVANEIAIEQRFWLADAFASGGSFGYDHKAMGITAKGAWVSVQRHFLEIGTDVQTEPIKVVGCGDMSGDVFGNGMVLSKAIKLVAAFDHRHIFLDPAPEPAKSWAERHRLLALPRSTWADYDPALISKGGGVFARTEKAINLSPEIRAVLGIDVHEIDPGALISAILKAPVDLIWFGGIGTYVKSFAEANGEVGDPSNDRLRVNAEDLRARVIGEGANLGMTQAARIAFSMSGGRCNTDFIDNSAGVDCSDNEVNIKIALNREVIDGRLSLDDRNTQLLSMTEDVARLVIENNRLQALALSCLENHGSVAVPRFVRLMEILENSGRLDRPVEGLASNEEYLRRAQEGHGLTRPELAVLLATSKLALQDAIEQSALGNSPEMLPELFAAFPPAMTRKFSTAIEEHRLRREIVATKLANRIINRLGVLAPFELVEEEGNSLGDVAKMFVVAERLFGIPPIWKAIDNAFISEPARLALLDELAAVTRLQITELLRVAKPSDTPGTLLARLRPGVAALKRQAKSPLKRHACAQSRRVAMRLQECGAPDDLAAKIVGIFGLTSAVGLADVGYHRKIEVAALADAYRQLGQTLGIDWAQSVAAHIVASDSWERLLVAGLARDFQQMRLEFLMKGEGRDPRAQVNSWLASHAPKVAQFHELMKRARNTVDYNSAMLVQLANQARVLLASSDTHSVHPITQRVSDGV